MTDADKNVIPKQPCVTANRIKPRRNFSLKRATFSGGVLFRFQRQSSLAGTKEVSKTEVLLPTSLRSRLTTDALVYG